MSKGGATPTTVAAPAPPPSSSTLEIQQAKIDAARQAKAKKGINSTILQGSGQPLGASTNMPGTDSRNNYQTLLGNG